MDEIAKLQRRIAQLEAELTNERTGRKNDRATWQRKGALRELTAAFVRAGCGPDAARLAAESIVSDHASAKRSGAVRAVELALDEDGAIGDRSWLLDGYHDGADALAARFLEHAPFFRPAADPAGGDPATQPSAAASALREALVATGAGHRPLVAIGAPNADPDASPRDRARAELVRALGG